MTFSNILSFLCSVHRALALSSYRIFKQLYSKFFQHPRILFGETVLITGGASGLGKLLTKQLVEKHYCRVVIWDIDIESAVKTSQEVNPNYVIPYQVDVSNRHEVYKTAEKVKRDVGDVTILINNAGIVSEYPFLHPFSSDINQINTIHVNLLGHMWTVNAFLPCMMRKRKGHLITIASAAGLIGAKGLAEYCASKFGCIGFHESIQAELYSVGLQNHVYTTLINPYFTDTGMFNGVKTKQQQLLPILQPDYVVDKIIEAILYKKEIVNLPYLINFIPLFKFILSPSMYLIIMDFFGIHDSMKTFEKTRKN